MKGYYIGYKVKGSQDQYLYKTVESSSQLSFNGQKSSKITDNGIETGKDSVIGKKKNHHQSNAVVIHQNNVNRDEDNFHVILNALKPFTEYTILVQAYNSMGAGPRSDEVIIQTDEDGLCFIFISILYSNLTTTGSA